MTERVYGPHLLGRNPLGVDERDWKLEDYLETVDPLTAALNAAIADRGANRHVVAWAQLVTAKLVVPSPAPTPAGETVWQDPENPLDQGDQGTCVGHAWAQFGNTLPYDDKYTHEDALDIYYAATQADGSPDDPRQPGGGQQGASTRGGAAAMVKKGRIKAYAFTQNVATIKTWIATKGPVVLGTDWTDDMFNPDANGVIRPTGSVAGGHEYVLLADYGDLAGFINSWGDGWGLKGYFKMAWTDVAKLVSGDGECCTAVEVAV